MTRLENHLTGRFNATGAIVGMSAHNRRFDTGNSGPPLLDGYDLAHALPGQLSTEQKVILTVAGIAMLAAPHFLSAPSHANGNNANTPLPPHSSAFVEGVMASYQQIDMQVPGSNREVVLAMREKLGMQNVHGGLSELAQTLNRNRKEAASTLHQMRDWLFLGAGIVQEKSGSLTIIEKKRLKNGTVVANERTITEAEAWRKVLDVGTYTLKALMNEAGMKTVGSPLFALAGDSSSEAPATSSKAPSEQEQKMQKTAEAIVHYSIKDPGKYDILVMQTVGLTMEKVSLAPEVIPILDEAGYVIAVAIPYALIPSIALNPNVVQDVIEGPPQGMTQQQADQIRAQGWRDLLSGKSNTIKGADGKVLIQINAAADEAGNPGSADPNKPDFSNLPTPDLQDLMSKDVNEEKILDAYGRMAPKTAEVLKKYGLGNGYFVKARGDEMGEDGVLLPYLRLKGVENREEVISELLKAAQEDGLNTVLQVGPNMTMQPAQRALKSPNTLVVGVENGQGPNTEALVKGQFFPPKNPDSKSIAVFIPEDLYNVKSQFDEVELIMPSPSGQVSFVTRSADLLKPGGRLTVFFDPDQPPKGDYSIQNTYTALMENPTLKLVDAKQYTPEEVFNIFGISDSPFLVDMVTGAYRTVRVPVAIFEKLSK